MSQPVPVPHGRGVPETDDTGGQDAAAARAVMRHHAALAAGLDERVGVLLDLVEVDLRTEAEQARSDLLDFVRREILPHARAEERVLYPPAASADAGLLVRSMIDEHRVLAALVTQLADATSPVRAAAAAQALATLFAVHLAKENDLVLPLLVAAAEVSLAALLAGMHELLGDEPGQETAGRAGGCGGDGGCGCGGAQGPSDAVAPVLTVDTRLDVREVPHDQRHALVLSTVAGLPAGEAVVLIASHAPRPVLAEIDHRFGGQIRTQWLQSGPQVWQVRLERVTQPA
jgi:uncharacterized protein (DUF2249 family)/iron-sulfur cluster repair protein YtfE (RIC family)